MYTLLCLLVITFEYVVCTNDASRIQIENNLQRIIEYFALKVVNFGLLIKYF